MKRIIIAAALATTTLAAPAFAAGSDFRMEVAYSSAKMATPAGAAAEYDFIQDQVSKRCEAENKEIKFAADFAQEFCVRRTMDRAVRSIGNANLKQVHLERR